jgi:type III secretory pathway component EscR
MRLPVIERDAYTVYLQPYKEEEQLRHFIHCDIHHRWTKTVKQQLQQDFELFCSLHKQPLYTLSYTSDNKHHKFLVMFGFKLHKEMPLRNGRVMLLYIKQGY